MPCSGNRVLHVNSSTQYSRGFGLPGVPKKLRISSLGNPGPRKQAKDHGLRGPVLRQEDDTRRNGGWKGSVVVAPPRLLLLRGGGGGRIRQRSSHQRHRRGWES